MSIAPFVCYNFLFCTYLIAFYSFGCIKIVWGIFFKITLNVGTIFLSIYDTFMVKKISFARLFFGGVGKLCKHQKLLINICLFSKILRISHHFSFLFFYSMRIESIWTCNKIEMLCDRNLKIRRQKASCLIFAGTKTQCSNN